MRSEAGLLSVPRPIERPATVVVACVFTPQRRARLTDALRGKADLRFTDSFDQLTQSLRSTIESVDAVVVSARDLAGVSAVRAIRLVIAERPRTAIVAYCQAGSQYSDDIRSLAVAGVHQFVFAGVDDMGVAFRAVLDAARRECAGEWVMHVLAPVVPSMLHRMIEAILARPDAVTSIRALADALGVHRKTLFNRCESAGFLPPAEVLAWTRLTLVAHLLDTTGCTIEKIAVELAFPSDTALRNMIKRYTGQRASDIRSHGGVQTVVASLVRRVADQATSAEKLHLV